MDVVLGLKQLNTYVQAQMKMSVFFAYCMLLYFQVSTLRFATRMMCVANEPAMNEVYDPSVSDLL